MKTKLLTLSLLLIACQALAQQDEKYENDPLYKLTHNRAMMAAQFAMAQSKMQQTLPLLTPDVSAEMAKEYADTLYDAYVLVRYVSAEHEGRAQFKPILKPIAMTRVRWLDRVRAQLRRAITALTRQSPDPSEAGQHLAEALTLMQSYQAME